MAIDIANDIKLMASQNMTDTTEGGGRMSGVEIIGGQTNNIFPDISRVDRTLGRVSLRKVFPACLSDNQDTYYGCHVIITDPPDDPNVKCWMFSTGSPTDTRLQARQRVEGYVIQDGRFIGYLWGDHPSGLKVLNIIAPQDYPDPDIGDVLCLVWGTATQFVKIIESRSEIREFELLEGKVRRKVFTFGITPALKYNFKGNDVIMPTLPPSGTSTTIFKTFGSDITDYFGVATLASSASAGDLRVLVDTVYTQIVPVNRAETPLVDLSLASVDNSSAQSFVSDGVGVIPSFNMSVYVNIQSGLTIYTGASIKPFSLMITAGSTTWGDDGKGNLKRGSNIEGYVAYEAGQIIFLAPGITGNNTLNISFLRASRSVKAKFTVSQDVTVATQGITWVFNLHPLPERGSVIVDYRTQGRWYRLVDTGSGSLEAEIAGTGGGTVNYSTGTVVVTTAAPPDIGSSVICYWNNTNDRLGFHYYKMSVTHDDMYFQYTTAHAPVAKNTVTITWTESGQQRSLTDNGNGGLTGNGSGTIDYITGTIKFLPTNLVPPNTAFTITYAYGDPIEEEFVHPAITEYVMDGGTYRDKDGNLVEKIDYGWIDLPLQNTPIPNTIRVQYDCFYEEGSFWYMENYTYRTFPSTIIDPMIILTDDGNGNLLLPNRRQAKMRTSGTWEQPTTTPFSVNYTDKIVRIGTRLHLYHAAQRRRVVQQGSYYILSYDSVSGNYVEYIVDPEKVVVKVRYYAQAGTNTAQETFSSPLYIPLTGSLHGVRLVANSAVIAFAPSSAPTTLNLLSSNTCFEYEGVIYRLNFSGGSFSKQAIGVVDRKTCLVTLNTYPSFTGRPNLSLSGEYTYAFIPVYSATFRVQSPVRPGSFILNFYTFDGGQQTVVASPTGSITGDWVSGSINYQTGVVKLKFGRWVNKNTFSDAPWYDSRLVEGDYVWQPTEVDPESIRYSAVCYTYIPVDPDLIGLNPIMLPVDGKVPIFRPGFVAIVHNTKETVLPNNLQGGQQISLPRGNLTYCDLYDSEGRYVPKTKYTVNLQSGVITMANPLDLEGFVQPLIAVHRIEDMKLVSRVDPSGHIYFTTPLKNSYTSGDTYVSSALICGDLRAYVYNVFDQQTWTGVFSDTLIGNPCSANYNIVDYPIIITNKGAIAERWAIVFTSTNTVNVIGETVGQILSNASITSDIAPINPSTQVPYFVIKAGGWGSGWVSGNVLRFNTTAAHYPIWIGRTVLPGDAVYDQDSFTIQIRGDAH